MNTIFLLIASYCRANRRRKVNVRSNSWLKNVRWFNLAEKTSSSLYSVGSVVVAPFNKRWSPTVVNQLAVDLADNHRSPINFWMMSTFKELNNEFKVSTMMALITMEHTKLSLELCQNEHWAWTLLDHGVIVADRIVAGARYRNQLLLCRVDDLPEAMNSEQKQFLERKGNFIDEFLATAKRYDVKFTLIQLSSNHGLISVRQVCRVENPKDCWIDPYTLETVHLDGLYNVYLNGKRSGLTLTHDSKDSIIDIIFYNSFIVVKTSQLYALLSKKTGRLLTKFDFSQTGNIPTKKGIFEVLESSQKRSRLPGVLMLTRENSYWIWLIQRGQISRQPLKLDFDSLKKDAVVLLDEDQFKGRAFWATPYRSFLECFGKNRSHNYDNIFGGFNGLRLTTEALVIRWSENNIMMPMKFNEIQGHRVSWNETGPNYL